MRFIATALPGLGPVVRDEVRALPDAIEVGRPGFDGRVDLVVFEHPAVPDLSLATAEDLLVEVAAAPRLDRADVQAQALTDLRALERALSAYATMATPLRPRMTYRLVVRVLDEERFLRKDLRGSLRAAVSELRPRWREGDPAQIELWVLQVAPDLFRLGIRLTGQDRSRRTNRARERPGALRPAVAAAMVRLAGPPADDAVLLDPCCGSGTILIEAAEAGWMPFGTDIDPEAVAIAGDNAAEARVWTADARALPVPDRSTGAVVSNLPFGRQFHVPGDPGRWTGAVLREMSRVSVTGAPIVLLAPAAARVKAAVEASRGAVALERRLDIELLGAKTSVWVLRRT